jgi:aspartate/methionine/tyrosine aminotransferase
MSYRNFSREELLLEKEKVEKNYKSFLAENLNLAMSRGKPNELMVNLTAGKFSRIDVYSNRIHKDGTDLGNYDQGLITGIKEIKELFSQILDVPEESLIVCGNSSLNLMFDMFSQLMLHGNCDSEKPWGREDKVKFICPVPGYDRHFAICEYMGIEMINVPMTDEGPDMDMVEDIVGSDETVKGIWCVPQYSNPDGTVYSDKTIARLAGMMTKAVDFRIFWDNAYSVHHLFNEGINEVGNILKACEDAGNPNRAYIFASTSKISIPGSGVAAIAASSDNVDDIVNRMKKQTIGYDKLNMLRHALAFPDKDAVLDHMREVASLLEPNFKITLDTLESELGNLDIAKWSHPAGGYFISFDTTVGKASRIVELCSNAGVKLTPAGAPYPYRKDPGDSNIRIAPTFPSYDDMKKAAEIFCTCAKLSALEQLTEEA